MLRIFQLNSKLANEQLIQLTLPKCEFLATYYVFTCYTCTYMHYSIHHTHTHTHIHTYTHTRANCRYTHTICTVAHTVLPHMTHVTDSQLSMIIFVIVLFYLLEQHCCCDRPTSSDHSSCPCHIQCSRLHHPINCDDHIVHLLQLFCPCLYHSCHFPCYSGTLFILITDSKSS